MAIRLAGVIAAMLLMTPGWARGRDTASWDRVLQLDSGQRVEITQRSGPVIRGPLLEVSEDSIAIGKGRDRTVIRRGDVMRVRRHSRRAMWIGLGVGAGGGAAAGAALGTRLANESGGDFANLKTGVTLGCAGAGALIGLLIGSLLGGGGVVYVAP